MASSYERCSGNLHCYLRGHDWGLRETQFGYSWKWVCDRCACLGGWATYPESYATPSRWIFTLWRGEAMSFWSLWGDRR